MSLRERVENLEKGQCVEKDYATKALRFTKFIIWIFLTFLSIVAAIFSTIFFLWWGETKKDIQEEVRTKLSAVMSEEIFEEYEKEANHIIDGLKTEIQRERTKKDLHNRREFYTSRGRQIKALEIGDEIIREFPEDPWSYYNQAVSYSISDIFNKEQLIRLNLEKAFELGEEIVKPYFEIDVDVWFDKYKDKEWSRNLID